MSDWADECVDAICELTIEALSHEEWRVKFQAEMAAALRAAERRGRVEGVREAADFAIEHQDVLVGHAWMQHSNIEEAGFIAGDLRALADRIEKGE
jgi:hypothetical protein